MRLRTPLLWYLGIAVVVPLLDGVPPGVHTLTTLAVVAGFLMALRLYHRLRLRGREMKQ